jgi:hypothetical protein
MRRVSPRIAYKKIGPDLVQKVAKEYQKFVESPTSANKKSYLTWRLRIHLRCNLWLKPELYAANKEYNLGLDDKEAGTLMWDFEQG